MDAWRWGTALVALVLFAPAAAAGEEDVERLERTVEELRREVDELKRDDGEKVREVERRQGILTDELRKVREALVLPETKELKSSYGLGPAASKVYGVERGLSIGGYGEANYKSVVSDRGDASDNFDFYRFILYFGYKYNDWIVLNSEIEFEHATTGSTVSAGSGSASVEFATLDFLLHPAANARFGLVLVPVGFINEIHEPPFYHGNFRPQVERLIIPSTWRSNGFGLFGELLPGLEYRTYGITSFNAAGFGATDLRGGRQKGNRERAEDWSWVGRADYTLFPGTLIGGSAYVGNQGQDQEFAGEEADVFMQMYEAHAQVRMRGLELRALGVVADIDDADVLSEANRQAALEDAAPGETPDFDVIGERLLGYYFEAAYDVLPLFRPSTTQYLAPWIRYQFIDTQDDVPSGFSRHPATEQTIVEVGLSYKPIPQVVLKADYRNLDSDGGDLPDEVRLGGGFVF